MKATLPDGLDCPFTNQLVTHQACRVAQLDWNRKALAYSHMQWFWMYSKDVGMYMYVIIRCSLYHLYISLNSSIVYERMSHVSLMCFQYQIIKH